MTVNMDWLRQKVRSREAKPIWYDGLGDMERQEEYRAYSALLAFLEGYDPHETLPAAGQLVWLEFDHGQPDAGYWDYDREWWRGQKQAGCAWEADLDAVRRWYPLPGGGR